MNGYFTEEELNRLIEQMERQPLYAPAHLQENVLCKLNELELCKPTAEELHNREIAGRKAFFFYSLRMAAGMAAAIVLLFAVPASDGSNRSYAATLRQEREAVEDKLDTHFENGREKLSGISKNINQWIDKILQREDLGGFDYES